MTYVKALCSLMSAMWMDVKRCWSGSYLKTLLTHHLQYKHAKTFFQEQGQVYTIRLSTRFLVGLWAAPVTVSKAASTG